MRKFKAVILAMVIMAICASGAAASANVVGYCNSNKGAIYNSGSNILNMLNMFADNGCTTMIDELMEVFATMNLNPWYFQ